MGSMDGMVTVVTGGSTGIGRAIVEAYAHEGAAVAMIARTASDIEAAAREVAEATGALTLGLAADVSSEADVERSMAAIEQALGPIDVLVNNAGVPGPRAFMQQHELAEFEHVLRVNVLGTFLCSKAVAPQMVGRQRGRIINMSGGGGGGSAVRVRPPMPRRRGRSRRSRARRVWSYPPVTCCAWRSNRDASRRAAFRSTSGRRMPSVSTPSRPSTAHGSRCGWRPTHPSMSPGRRSTRCSGRRRTDSC